MTTPLNAYTLRAPGIGGLNTQDSPINLEPIYALELVNATFDESGRIAARKGWTKLTTSALTGTPDIEQIHVFETTASAYEVIYTATVSTNKKIYSARAGDSPAYSGSTDVTGTATPTSNNWQFANFLGRAAGAAGSTQVCIGAQTGEQLIYMAAGGTFATITAASGAVPTSNCVLAAFGRVWATTTALGNTVAYSALLDETHWSTGAGTIDVGARWPGNGSDYVVALAAFNGYLIVFGSHNILIYDSPENVTNLALVDTIAGVGCIARDSVQDIGTDILFLSDTGVRSLARTIETTSMPVQEVAKKVRDTLSDYVSALSNYDAVRSVYNQREGFYLLILGDYVFCFDCKNIDPSIGLRASLWEGMGLTCMAYARNGTMYTGHEGGVIGYYDDNYQDNTSQYTFKYLSPWLGFGEEVGDLQKFVKKATITTLGGEGRTMTARLGYDFETAGPIGSKLIPAATTTVSEYGISEYGIAEYNATSYVLNNLKYNGKKAGQYVQVGFSVSVDGDPITVQKIDLYYKAGRLAR